MNRQSHFREYLWAGWNTKSRISNGQTRVINARLVDNTDANLNNLRRLINLTLSESRRKVKVKIRLKETSQVKDVILT